MKHLPLAILLSLFAVVLPACKNQKEKDFEAAMQRHEKLQAEMKARQESYEKSLSKPIKIDPLKPWANLEHPQQNADKTHQQVNGPEKNEKSTKLP